MALRGVGPAEWLAWLQRIGRKLDRLSEKSARAELPVSGAGDAPASALPVPEERVANIEGKLDITSTFEPN
jgi:hypothetical protein